MAPQPLDIAERVRLGLRLGESHFREFKSALDGPPHDKRPRQLKAILSDVARSLVAFANADGGELLIGIEDNGTVTGIPHDANVVQDILAGPKTHVHADTPLPAGLTMVVDIDGRIVVYFYVPKGTQYVYLTSDGRCLQRVDRDSVPISSERVLADRLEAESRNWDRMIAPGADLTDLDLDLVESVASQIAYGISAEKCLQYLDLAEFTVDGLRVKNAAIMLFAKDIRRWHPRCQVRILTFRGRERLSGARFNVDRDEVVANNVLRLVDTAWERLTVALSEHTRLTESARFEQTLLFPQIACREALVNAIVHRNYAVEGRGIELSVFSDRLEIVSPGMLLSTVSLEDLIAAKGVHESRNPLIARVLREVGLLREMGEGVRRIFDVMKSNALAAPVFHSDTTGFSVTLSNRSLYPDDVKLWLTNFDEFGLSEEHKAVMALGYQGRIFSTQDVIDRLGIVDTAQVQEVLTPLRSMRLIERTASHGNLIKRAASKRVPKRAIPSLRVAEEGSWRRPGSGILSALGPPDLEGPETPARSTVDESESQPFDEPPAGQRVELHLGNLSFETSDGDVVSFMQPVCDVIGLSVPRYQGGPRNRGYAFATVAYAGDPESLVRRLDGLPLDGRPVAVQRARTSRGGEPSARVNPASERPHVPRRDD